MIKHLPKYKFRSEISILMYLKQYQFVLGADLEGYPQSENEVFNNNNPCNIYFILRRPKVTLNPKSIVIDEKKVLFDLIIHGQEMQEVSVGLEMKEAQSALEFKTKYPYNLFGICDTTGLLFVARPSTLIDSDELKEPIENPILDYEVLYIGQAFGKDGNRTAIERLGSHETLQKIYAHSSTQYPDSDIWIMLTNFSQQSLLFTAAEDRVKNPKENMEIEDKKIEKILKNNGLQFTEKQRINFTEAALIRYFKPQYNNEFKSNFPDERHKSYSECYDLDVRSIAIELDTSEMVRKIYTESAGRTDWHCQTFDFLVDADRFSFLNID